jgi:hypothetical protein
MLKIDYVDAFTRTLIGKREPVFTLEHAMLILLQCGYQPSFIAAYVDDAYQNALNYTQPRKTVDIHKAVA